MGSVVIQRNALLRAAMIFHGRLETHAGGELIDHAALYLLPRRLARRIFVATLLLQRGAPLRELGVRNQHVGATLVEVDAHAVAGLEQGKPATHRRLGGGVDDRRRGGGAGLASVADAV